MQPSSPFQVPTPNPQEPATRWQWMINHLSKIYIWLPGSLLLIVAVSIGVYYWLAGAQPATPSGRTSSIGEVEELSGEAESSTSEKKTKKSAKDNQDDATPVKDKIAKPLPASSPPSSLVKPNSGNTGPRYRTTRTLTPNAALAELRRTGSLSRVTISGSLKLSGSDGRNWVIEDSIIRTSSRYGLQTYASLADFTGAMNERPVFRYVEIIGSAAVDGSNCGAVVYGEDVVLQHADLYGCDDSVKAKSRMSIISSWLHDNDHPSGAHCDSLQIRSGRDILIRGNRFDAYVGYSSDGSSSLGGTCSGGLQTGSVTNTISARFENNWFAGGHYTIRGWASRDESHSINYVFRNNKWMRHGTSVTLGRTNLPPNRYGATTGSLGSFDSSNVWENTRQPVRD